MRSSFWFNCVAAKSRSVSPALATIDGYIYLCTQPIARTSHPSLNCLRNRFYNRIMTAAGGNECLRTRLTSDVERLKPLATAADPSGPSPLFLQKQWNINSLTKGQPCLCLLSKLTRKSIWS